MIVSLCFACSAAPAAIPSEEESYPVASPVAARAAYEREYVGEIQASQRIELRARTRGIVESIAVDEGQKVHAGQPLFTLSARELQQVVNRARAASGSAAAELRAAQIDQASTKLLLEKKIVSQSELSVADSKVSLLEARLAEARAAESEAEINLAYARVHSPMDGVVNRLPKKVGSIVDDGELLTTVTNTDEVFVYFRVSEREYYELEKSGVHAAAKEVSLRLANGDLYPSKGTIDTVENEFDRETGNIAFRARFKNHEGLLKHGSTGTIILRTELEGGLLIPQASTFEVQDQLYVYMVDAQNTARLKKIVPRARLKDAFVLESGLSPDDRFVAEGVQKLRDGVKIAVRATASPAASAL